MYSFVWLVSSGSSYMYFPLVSFFQCHVTRRLNTDSCSLCPSFHTGYPSLLHENLMERSTFVQWESALDWFLDHFRRPTACFGICKTEFMTQRQTILLSCERYILNAFVTRFRRNLSCDLLPVTFI